MSEEPIVVSNTGEVAEFSGNDVAPAIRQRLNIHEIFGAIYKNKQTENSVMPYSEFTSRFKLGVSLSHLVATLTDPYIPSDETEPESCSYCTKDAVVQGSLEIAGKVGGTESYAHLSLCQTHREKIERQHPNKFKVVSQD